MTETPRTLLLMRHAKSSWDTAGRSDFDRPLAPRGERDAPRIGLWLREHVDRPQHVTSSPARRAAETVRLVSEAAGLGEGTIQFDERIYGAGFGGLLQVIGACPDTARTALFVGHNPGMWELAEYLSGRPIPIEEGQKSFPTGALAVLRTEYPWDVLDEGSAELVTVVRPRTLD